MSITTLVYFVCVVGLLFCFETWSQAAQAGLSFTTQPRLALTLGPPASVSGVLGLHVCATRSVSVFPDQYFHIQCGF